MEIEYDPAKDAINLEKHHLPLAVGRVVLENRVGDELDLRQYGEVRRIGYGLVSGRLFACVYTMRGETYRIISVRKANEREQQKWLRSK